MWTATGRALAWLSHGQASLHQHPYDGLGFGTFRPEDYPHGFRIPTQAGCSISAPACGSSRRDIRRQQLWDRSAPYRQHTANDDPRSHCSRLDTGSGRPLRSRAKPTGAFSRAGNGPTEQRALVEEYGCAVRNAEERVEAAEVALAVFCLYGCFSKPQ
jgi:hypothetical protein